MPFSVHMTLSWVGAIVLALLLFAVASCSEQSQAGDWSLDLKGGLNFPIRTTPDSTYWQEPYPRNTKLLTGAYAVGLHYDYTPAVSFQGHYLDLGSSRINGQAISDENYDHINHRCKSGTCIPHYSFRATDSLRGGDLTATYTWRRDGIEPFVKGGFALLYHRAIFRNQDGTEDRFNGWLPELEFGAGLAYRLFYVELDYFQGLNFGGQNLPISTQQVAMFGGVKLPIN